MTTFESRRAAVEARRAVASRPTSGSEHEMALQKYLAATTHLSHLPASAAPLESVAVPAQPTRRPAPTVAPGAAPDLIVVGTEGSSCARGAADWAAEEAQLRAGSLLLMYAYVLPPVGYSAYNPYPPNMLSDLRNEGCAVLADTESELQRTHPDLPISTRLVYGDPKKVLARASRTAALTVVGAHGRNRVGMALGSVAGHLAHTNPAPVAVIRPGAQAASGSVVVGVDGSASSDAALSFAFRSASARGAAVLAVHCCVEPDVNGVPSAFDVDLLEDRIAGYRRMYPAVHADAMLSYERPTPVLLECAENAQLVVVGSRGHNALSGMVLGSTGQALISRSASPVVIVPSAS